MQEDKQTAPVAKKEETAAETKKENNIIERARWAKSQSSRSLQRRSTSALDNRPIVEIGKFKWRKPSNAA
jgi:hypothetical protein